MLTVEIDAPALPIVDASELASPDLQLRAAAIAKLKAACVDKGFLYLVGHGVPQELIDRTFDYARQFFDKPMEEKAALDVAHSLTQNRGYEVPGLQTLDPGTLPDLKESFLMGVDYPLDHPCVVAGQYNRGPNQWPGGLPGFKETMNAYSSEMERLARLLMSGIAQTLGLPEDFFDDFNRDPVSVQRLLYYPPQPVTAREGEIGCGAHTDFGGVTLLMQDDSGGLQVKDPVRGWVDAPPIPGSFVVNLGDMIARWTNDRYRSNLHRVINTSGKARYSLPYFFDGHPDYVVDCLPGCADEANPSKYLPITVEQHLRDCFAATY